MMVISDVSGLFYPTDSGVCPSECTGDEYVWESIWLCRF